MSSTLMKSLQVDASEQSLRALYRDTAASSTGSPSTAWATAGWPRSSSRTSSRASGATPTSSTRSGRRFRTWLYGIARNAVIDFNRRRSVRPCARAARARRRTRRR